jgi:hypothetical protein
MKIQGVIRGSTIVLKKLPSDDQIHEGANVEVIVLPTQKNPHRFSTFKFGVKQEYLSREAMYEQS